MSITRLTMYPMSEGARAEKKDRCLARRNKVSYHRFATCSPPCGPGFAVGVSESDVGDVMKVRIFDRCR
jgi:hypothetical protein